MPERGYRGVAGQPVQPYVLYTIPEASDIWLNLTFVDRFGNAATPTNLTYRIDNLTTDTVVLETATVPTPYSNQMSVNIPAVLNVITNDIGQTSQTNQVSVVATFSDGSMKQNVFVYEVIAVQIVNGSNNTVTTVVLTSAPAPNSTSGTLISPWIYPTGLFQGTFSDGETVTITLTNGLNTATWTPALVGTVGTVVQIVIPNTIN
jgi:hypothetical protein